MEENEKKLGVIGGLGPKSTAFFYDLVTDLTLARVDQDHINAIILSHPELPDRTTAILSGEDQELRTLLIKDALLLESLGATHIAIPCNTSHYFWQDIQDSVNIPVINMIEEVINYVRLLNGGKIKKIGVLATNGTVKTGIYDKECLSNSIEIAYPNDKHQQKVMEVIYNGIKGGKGAKISDLEWVIKDLKKQKCDAVVLGCTELSVLFDGDPESYIIDALYPLARRAIQLSGKPVKV